jgi:putative two-component system response regulator
MTMNVLAVDDDPVTIAVYRSLLEDLDDVSPIAFTQPEDALRYCGVAEPDLVILDYMMPSIDGVDFVRRLRKTPGRAEIPIVVVTANRDREVRQRALEAGATDFLGKPVDSQEFTVRVRNMLALRRAFLQVGDRARILALEVATATEKIRANERDTLYALARAAEYKDPETGAHIIRMANYARMIGGRLGLTAEEQDTLLQAAPLHDIGKIGTPDHILLKAGPLTADERVIMNQHATNGWRILRSHVSPILQAGATIAHTHHEKFDGSGYPQGLAGEAIPLFGRIVAVADVFDALTSVRPYKEAWPVERARDFLSQGSAKHFDPACVRAFLDGWADAMEIKKAHPG